MSFWQAVNLAINAIKSNKLRAFLTMLGVIIGVGSVIALVALAKGSTQQVTNQIQSMGTNLITVMITGRGSQTTFTYEEALELGKKPGIVATAPVSSGSVTVKYGNKTKTTTVEGTNAEYEQVRNTHVQSGRFILPIDVEYRQKVCLLGTEVAQELFGNSNPVGETVKINGANFLVVGLLESKGTSMGGSSDNKVIIPITTAESLLKNRGVRTIYFQAESPESVNQAITLLEASLLKKFKYTDKSKDTTNTYRVMNQTEMLSTVNQVTGTLTLMLGGIAGISLLVGGIGIMNIMLVSVTERTKEIGIRKAIGARRRDIMAQFLVESVVLSGIGGLAGIILGIGASSFLGKILNIPAWPSFGTTIMAFGFAVLVGIFFGIYPAGKASRLNPIEALRYE